MVFSSGVFLFIFMPVVIILHTIIKNITVRNIILIVASLVFYSFGEPVYILLLLMSVALNFFFGRILGRKKSRGILAFAVVINLAMLVVLKYTGFLVDLINNIPGINIPVPKITMPIGISFFTFQAISYVVDTYRSKEDYDTGFFDVLLFISLFPQLIAGPIVRFNTIRGQIKERSVGTDGIVRGIRRFVFGLSKKMLIANTMAYTADYIFKMSTSDIGTSLAWLGAVCYTLQIYFDFSGYSDMACGLGSMMGFDFPENFNYPYVASSIRGFWRRWHMSLTAWFREYLYIPLGGNKKGTKTKLFNTMIVFICTGIWHGANLTFIVWGLMHGILMCVESLIIGNKKEERFNFFKWLYTILVVIIGFVIFRADNISYAVSYIGKMFTLSASGFNIMLSMLTPTFIVTLIAAFLVSTPVFKKIFSDKKKRAYPALNYISYGFSLVLLMLCVMCLAADSYNPFIYYRF